MFENIGIFQIIVLVFVLFALSRVILRFKDHKITFGSFFFWTVIWAAALVVLFIPQITAPAARLLNIGRGVDVAVYFSIVLLFYLLFRLYVRMEKIDQEITVAVRESAISKAKRKR